MARVFTVALFLFLTAIPAFAAPSAGEAFYRTKCARCHGPNGEGVKRKYDKPLTGELAIPQLAEVVRKTMPEDDPGSLSKEDATAVSAWMHETFYSAIARERNRPARVDLARLTVNQYRNAVSDLIGTFRANTNRWTDGGKGLKAEYFAERGYGKRQLERVDPLVNFDFGTNPPTTEGTYGQHEFSIRWTGSVLAPESGEYAFIVRSDQAVLLWVNGTEPIVNANVRSGNQTEYIAPVYLTGGRVYNLKLEFSKALQGVKDKDPKPKPAFVSLDWKLPHGTSEPIPTRYLSPNPVPEQHLVSVPFPADDKSLGWERGSAVSKEWDAATTESALEASAFVVKNLNQLGEIDPKSTPEKQAEQAKKFALRLVERAFRRPLTDEQKELYVNRQFTATKNDPAAAIKRVVLLTLKSPRFLFREVGAGADSYDVAARLAFALWDSMPDTELLNAASQGKLKTKEELVKQAERMLNDPRAKVKVRGFLMHWLRLDQDRDLGKNAKLYPEFDSAIVADLRTSLEMFLDEVVWSKESDFRQLFKSEEVYLNGRLAKVYGAEMRADAPFQKVKLDAGKRAGVLTHPYLMTTFAYSDHTSPIHRGVFLAKGILGTGLKPPQDAFSPLSADAHPMLTTRERVALQTKGANCQSCHNVINPLGFTLESFDAVGKLREKDNNQPVNTNGEYLTRSGETKKFTGAVELAKFLADSPEVHQSFTVQLFHHLIQQPIRAYGSNRDQELREMFVKNGYSIQKLMVEIASTAALTSRTDSTALPPAKK